MALKSYDLSALTTEELAALVAGSRPVAVLVPVGSVEPHGPHLPLSTDTLISRAAAERAVELLSASSIVALVGPPVPYGVTRCAGAFAGAVSVSPATLESFLREIVNGILDSGVKHVCLVNNHLEPEHDAAVRSSVHDVAAGRASVASPLTRRWARTLSDEFKSGACHAGCYETSIVMASDASVVKEAVRASLPEVPISLSDKLASGVTNFMEMGLKRSYAGAPADASVAHGRDMIERLGEMIATEVREALSRDHE